jgi:predicted secreted protein
MKIGEIFTIERDSSPSTGYQWHLVHLENLALIDENFQYSGTDNAKIGNIGKQVFIFQAINEGTAKIQFAKYRTFEPNRVLYDDVRTYEINELKDTANAGPGSWKPFEAPDADAVKVFKAGVTVTGVDYEPVLVTSHIVNGSEYLFLANAKIVTAKPEVYPVAVRIHAGSDGKVSLKNIKNIGHPAAVGGYGVFGEESAESKDAFDTAFKRFVGMDVKRLAVSAQIVNGVNYLIAGNAKSQYPEAPHKPVLIKVYAPRDGDARIVDIIDAYEV